MRLLADVNIESQAVAQLRAAGHDVLWAQEKSPESPDVNLLRQATQEQRILFTHDEDFGELIRRLGEPAPYGVIRFRIHRTVPAQVVAKFIAGAVISWEQWPPGLWTIQIRKGDV